ncbi:hypothetical protein EBS02_08755 [bacterium]|nr:hypothetical protein [bacterium]
MQLEGIVLDKITEALTSKEFKEYWTQIKDHFTVEQINQIARSGDWYNSIEALQAGNQEVLLKEGLSRSHIISQFLTGLLSMQSTLIHDLNITVDGFDPGSLINTIYVGMQYFSLPISPESKELVTRYKALKDLPADRSQKLLKGIIGDQRLDKVLETSLLGSLSGIVDTYITLEKQKESHSTCEAAKMLQTFQQTKGDQGLFSAYKEELKKDSDDLTVSLKNFIETTKKQQTYLQDLKRFTFIEKLQFSLNSFFYGLSTSFNFLVNTIKSMFTSKDTHDSRLDLLMKKSAQLEMQDQQLRVSSEQTQKTPQDPAIKVNNNPSPPLLYTGSKEESRVEEKKPALQPKKTQ